MLIFSSLVTKFLYPLLYWMYYTALVDLLNITFGWGSRHNEVRQYFYMPL